MATLLDRYKHGEYVQVWSELMAYGQRVRQKQLLPEASAVTLETMSRARHNIELLIPRLVEVGYEFEDIRTVLVAPAHDVSDTIAELEEQAGPLPLSIRAWYEQVGAVSFMGIHPEWHRYFEEAFLHDPLVVDPVDVAFEECLHRSWTGCAARSQSTEFYHLVIAPDEYHKSNISGGDPYHIELPCPGADARLDGERHNTTFVDYLRLCFRWGGFPGFERCKSYPRDAISYVTEGLLRI